MQMPLRAEYSPLFLSAAVGLAWIAALYGLGRLFRKIEGKASGSGNSSSAPSSMPRPPLIFDRFPQRYGVAALVWVLVVALTLFALPAASVLRTTEDPATRWAGFLLVASLVFMSGLALFFAGRRGDFR